MKIVSKQMFGSNLTFGQLFRAGSLMLGALIVGLPVDAQLNYSSRFGAATQIAGTLNSVPGQPGNCPAALEFGSFQARVQGGDGSASATDGKSLRTHGGGQASSASANAATGVLQVRSEGADGTCTYNPEPEKTETLAVWAQGNATAVIYDTITISSPTLAENTPVTVALQWQVRGSFSARIAAGSGGGERGAVYFDSTASNAGANRQYSASQGASIADKGSEVIYTFVGDSFQVKTRLTAILSHPESSSDPFPMFVGDFTASAVVRALGPDVVVTRATAP